MSYKKFTKHVGILGLTQAVIAISGIITLPIITKFLGAQNYGTWIQLLVTIGLITPVATLGLSYTLVRFLAGEKDVWQIQDGVWSVTTVVFLFSAVIALGLLFFAPALARFFQCDKIFIAMLAGMVILECLNQVFGDTLRAFQDINKYSFFMIFQSLTEAGLVIISILLGYGLFGAVVALLLTKVIIFVSLGSITIKKIGITVPKFLKMKEYLFFGVPGILRNASSWALQSSDRYLIAFFLGTVFVGYYSPAYTLGGLIIFFINPVSFILPAILAQHYDDNKLDEVKKYLKYSLKYFLLLAIPAVFGLTVLSKQLLTIFSTQDIALQSYYVVPFVALSMLFLGVYMVVDQVTALRKKTHISGAIWAVATVVNIGLNIFLIPRFGILGAAITTLVAYVLILVATCYYSLRKLLFDIDWKFIGKSISASLVMSALVFLLNPAGLWKTLLAVALGSICYFMLIFLFKGLGKKEVSFLTSFFSKNLSI
jgi:O-antigen/teichoic acid export membrane protein